MIYKSRYSDKGSGATIKGNSFDCPGYTIFIKVVRTKGVILTGNTFIKSSSATKFETTSVDNNEIVEYNNFSIDI